MGVSRTTLPGPSASFWNTPPPAERAAHARAVAEAGGRHAGRAFGQMQVIDPRAVHLLPGRADHPGQPARPPRSAPPMPPAASPRPAPAGSARGSRPAREWNRCAAGRRQAKPGQARQQRAQRQARQIAGHQPRPELAQHAGIKAPVIQLQAQRVLPRHPVPDRISSLPVRFSVNCSTLAIISCRGRSPAGPAPRTRRQAPHRHTPHPAARGSASPDSPSGTTIAPLSR